MRARPWLRAGASLGLLGLTAALVDVRGVAAELAGLSWVPAVGALVLSVPQLAVMAWRWSFTARRMELALPFARAWREYYASTLLNLVLPGGVVGDVSRVIRLRTAGGEGGAARVARCVLIERASGQVALWLTAAVGATALGWPQYGGWALAAVAGAMAVVVVLARSSMLRRSRIGASARTVVGELRASLLQDGAWAIQLGASLLAVALLGGMFWLCIVAIGAPVSGRQTLLIAPLVLAAAALPISVGGWGVREGAAAALFGAMGLPATQGAAASAAFGALSLVAALPGAWVLLHSREHAKDHPT